MNLRKLMNHPRHLNTFNTPSHLELQKYFPKGFQNMTLEETSTKFMFISDFLERMKYELNEKIILVSYFT